MFLVSNHYVNWIGGGYCVVWQETLCPILPELMMRAVTSRDSPSIVVSADRRLVFLISLQYYISSPSDSVVFDGNCICSGFACGLSCGGG